MQEDEVIIGGREIIESEQYYVDSEENSMNIGRSENLRKARNFRRY